MSRTATLARCREDTLIEALELLRESELMSNAHEARDHRNRAYALLDAVIDADGDHGEISGLPYALQLLQRARAAFVAPERSRADLRRVARQAIEREISPEALASLTTRAE